MPSWGYEMRQAVERMMARFGSDLVIVGEEEKTVRGFFRAVNSKSWQNMESQATALGEVTRGQYVYLGPAEAEVREGDTLRLGQREYLFRRVEPYWFGNEAVYRWGLCVEKGVNDIWDTRS